MELSQGKLHYKVIIEWNKDNQNKTLKP